MATMEARTEKWEKSNQITDNGLLPLLHTIIKILADKGHRQFDAIESDDTRFLFVEAAESILTVAR